MWDPDTRWVGNESGLATFRSQCYWYLNFSVLPEKKKGKFFVPLNAIAE